jgi:hypothetical protein
VTFLRLLARRLGQALAVLRDPDAGLLRPLPEAVIDPRIDAADLSRAAREQGRADGARFLFDGWSFGHAGEPPDAVLDPEYVQGLQQECEAAIHDCRDRQRLTDARLADLHLAARDAEQGMRGARERMARIAVRDQLDQEESLDEFLRRRNVDTSTLVLPSLGDPVWEGEAAAMHPVLRVLLVGFLFLVVFGIERYVAEAYLPVGELGRMIVLALTAATAAMTILGPLVAGHLFRHRHVTGYEGTLAALTFVLLLPALGIVVGFGLLAARLFDSGVPPGDGTAPATVGDPQSAALGLTPGTIVVIFTVVLFLACAMAYLLGLAQRHPFQQAFARSRARRHQTLRLMQQMGTRINPHYRATTPEYELGAGPNGEPACPGPGTDREETIRHAYLAAVNAYYQGLIEAVADPTFTEAVMRRRNRRTGCGSGNDTTDLAEPTDPAEPSDPADPTDPAVNPDE